MSCGVARRRSSDLALLWLWHRSAAVVPNRLLAWDPPHVTGAALKKTKRQKKKKKKKRGTDKKIMKIYVHTKTCTSVFIAALFIKM